MLVVAAAQPPVPHGRIYSQLWGEHGESWDTTKIPDFTHAGYRGGEPVPDFKKGATVTDFGAVADGATDNTDAFRKAIAACAPDEAVYIPSGTYLLRDTLLITKSNISLVSDAEKPAVLFFEKGLEELYPDFNSKESAKTKWSWSGAVILFAGKIHNVGISNLDITFPDSAWAGHNFHERGYNGIGFGRHVADGWVNNVTITGADVGIWIEASANHITADKLTLAFGPVRGAKALNGHHGLNVYGSYNLIENFAIKGQFLHDLTVSGATATYNVFHSGSCDDLFIDHHTHEPSRNLFTNLNAGAGTNLYRSGGTDQPAGLCFQETFWNITADKDMDYPDEKDKGAKHSSNNVCVGIRTNRSSALGDANGNWFETIAPADLYPKDLYLAQMQLRKNK